MKKIEIIIPDRLFNDVNKIIKNIHSGGMTFSRAEGRGNIKAKPVAIDRGTRFFTPEFIPRIKMEVVVKDDQVDGIVNRIVDELAAPNVGGKIFEWTLLQPSILSQRSGEKRLYNRHLIDADTSFSINPFLEEIKNTSDCITI